MKVLFWAEQFWPQIGGIEVWSAKLLAALQQRGHEFIIVASQDNPVSNSDNIYLGMPLYRFPFWRVLKERSLGQMMEIKRAVADLKKKFAPDLLHLNLTGPSVYYHLQTADCHPAPLLVSLHQPLEIQSDTLDSVSGRVLKAANWVTAGSAMVLSTGRSIAPDIASCSSIIPFGFDKPKIQPDPLPFEEPRLLCLGRLVYDKGFDLALTAFSMISDRFPRLRLIIASDGPARLDLERLTARLDLTHKVDFVGWVSFDKLPALLNSATMVLMPSRVSEGFGLVAMEAAVMGRPVVAARSGGIPEVIIDGETGLLFEKEHTEALAGAITHLVDHPHVAVKMGQAAQVRAQTVFNWERHVDAFACLYQRLGDAHAT